MLLKSLLLCLAATQLAAGHGAIVKAVGDQGGTGQALGSEYIRLGYLFYFPYLLTLSLVDDTTPRDGAGPYECMIDSTGAGTQWTNMAVVTNVPGTNSNSKAKATDFVCLLIPFFFYSPHHILFSSPASQCFSPSLLPLLLTIN